MGKNLHYIIEKKINNKWVGIMATDCLFSSVKQNIGELGWFNKKLYYFYNSIDDLNGFPDDASELALHEKARIEGHDHSWLYIEDIYQVWLSVYNPEMGLRDLSLNEALLLQVEFSKFIGINFLGSEDDGFEIDNNLRMLFFFDN